MRLLGVLSLRRSAREVAVAQLGVAAQVRARREQDRTHLLARMTGDRSLGSVDGDWRLALARRATLAADLGRACDALAAAQQDEVAAGASATRARSDFAAVEKAVERRRSAALAAADRAEEAELADVVTSLRAHRMLNERLS